MSTKKATKDQVRSAREGLKDRLLDLNSHVSSFKEDYTEAFSQDSGLIVGDCWIYEEELPSGTASRSIQRITSIDTEISVSSSGRITLRVWVDISSWGECFDWWYPFSPVRYRPSSWVCKVDDPSA